MDTIPSVLVSSKSKCYLVHPPLEGGKTRLIEDKLYTQVPFSLKNASLLRARGYPAGSPILFDGFRFTAPPKWQAVEDYQKITSAFLTLHRKAFCFNGMGTGKTASAVWAAEYLRSIGLVRRVLVICPVSTLADTWVNEIKSCALGADIAVLHGKRDSRVKGIVGSAAYNIINHDGMASVHRELVAQADIDLVICDEATAFKTGSATRTKVFQAVCRAHDRRVWALTGTPTAGAPTDMYACAKIICPERIPPSFTQFQEKVCVKVGDYAWVPRPNANEVVMEMLQPSICYTSEECLDIPPVETLDISHELGVKQLKIIDSLRDEHMAVLAGGEEITAANTAVMLGKCLQVFQGYVKHKASPGVEAGVAYVGADERLAITKQYVSQSRSKSIIYANFTAAVNGLYSALSADKECAIIDGTVTPAKRAVILDRFRNDPKLEVLIAHPRAMSHGVNATSASTMIWWGPCTSTETYSQACKRMARKGQQHQMTMVRLAAHPIERKIYAKNTTKLNSQTELLNLLSEL
jgi:SNF2 family DNA or RNA helicase